MALDPPTGEGSSEWLRHVVGRAQSFVSTRLRRILANDFDTDALSGIQIGGTGTVTYESGLSGGVANLQTGGTGSGYATTANAGGSILIFNPTSAPWMVHARCRIVTDADVEAGYHCIGIQGPTGADYMDLGLNGDIDPNFLSLRLVKASAETHEITGVPVDTTAMHNYAVGFDLDNQTISIIYDEDVVWQTTNLANLTDQPGYVYSFVRNGTTAANRQMYVDNMATVLEPSL